MESSHFEPLPRLHQFRRTTPFGFQCVILSVSTYEDLELVEFHLGIRFDQVEQMAFSFTNGLTGFQADSTTLITPLGRILGQEPLRYKIRHPDDVRSVVETFWMHFQSRGLPFFERFEKIKSLDTLFNAAPEEPCPWVNNLFHPAFRGLAVGALLARDDLAVLIEQHRAALHRFGAYGRIIENYNRLARYLLDYLHPN